jgi:hypothetical protein
MKGILFFLLFCVIRTMAGGIPIPSSEAPVKPHEIVTDSFSGIQVVSNQLQIIFHEWTGSREQRRILRKVGGKVVGGIPDKSIYQVGITNPDGSIDYVNRICTLLQKEKHVAYVTPRFIDLQGNKKTICNRKGALNIQPGARDKSLSVTDPMSDALNKNKQNLQSCFKIEETRHGKIAFRILLSPEGNVLRVMVLKSEITDRNLVKCLEYKIRKWQGFPSIGDDQVRQIDFTFKI